MLREGGGDGVLIVGADVDGRLGVEARPVGVLDEGVEIVVGGGGRVWE